MSADNSLTTFKAIANFVTCLNEVFGTKHKPLKLYSHLLSKTTLVHEKPIKKHIQAVSRFCVANRDAIYSKNKQKLAQTTIDYSPRVYINLQTIMSEADTETLPMIWQHLLILSALTDPTGKAKEILKDMIKDTNSTDKSEANFLNDIIEKVESQVNPESNPMEAVTSILQSGIFTDLISGMGAGLQDGSLDLSKLMGTVQKMVGNNGENKGGGKNSTETNNNAPENQRGGDQPPNAPDPMSLITNMMSNMNNPNAPGGGAPDLGALMGMMGNLTGGAPGGAPGAMPDLGALMGMMGPMLNSLAQPHVTATANGNGNSVEDQIDDQIHETKDSEQSNVNIPIIEELSNEQPSDSITEIDP